MSEFGVWGSALHHMRYFVPIDPKSRRRCCCGCKMRRTHIGMANGVGLYWGCELSVRRWVKQGSEAIVRKVPA